MGIEYKHERSFTQDHPDEHFATMDDLRLVCSEVSRSLSKFSSNLSLEDREDLAIGAAIKVWKSLCTGNKITKSLLAVVKEAAFNLAYDEMQQTWRQYKGPSFIDEF